MFASKHMEERRLRNAELERERRDVMADAYAELRDALAQDHTATRAQMLEGACEYIRSRPNLEVVKRQNQLLEEQIAILEAQLSEAEEDANTSKRRRLETFQSEHIYFSTRTTH